MPDAAAACAVAGCAEPGEFRAPISPGGQSGRDAAPRWRWLCLDHVRQHNDRYNYFAGMTADEIYAAQSPSAGWEAETRAFRAAGSADLPPRWSDFRDPIDALGARYRQRMAEARAAGAAGVGPGVDPRFSPEDEAALRLMGLDAATDRRALRQRYAQLLRLYHPDRNGGDRSHEAKLRAVVDAYSRLKSSRVFA